MCLSLMSSLSISLSKMRMIWRLSHRIWSFFIGSKLIASKNLCHHIASLAVRVRTNNSAFVLDVMIVTCLAVRQSIASSYSWNKYSSELLRVASSSAKVASLAHKNIFEARSEYFRVRCFVSLRYEITLSVIVRWFGDGRCKNCVNLAVANEMSGREMIAAKFKDSIRCWNAYINCWFGLSWFEEASLRGSFESDIFEHFASLKLNFEIIFAMYESWQSQIFLSSLFLMTLIFRNQFSSSRTLNSKRFISAFSKIRFRFAFFFAQMITISST